jgi:lysophospholipase L1-like esterase
VLKKSLLLTLALLAAPLTQAAPEKWTAAIDAFTKADATNPPPTGAVVFVGSSSIVKWKSLAEDFPDQKTVNRGFGGSELFDSVFYADRIVTPYKPRVVVVYAGDNDLKAGKSPETVAADFKAFRTKVHAAVPTARIVFIGIKPSLSRWDIRDKGIKANALIAADCATDKKRLVFVDVWQAMLGANGEPRPELYLADKLHMTPAGYAVWKPLVAPALK